MRLREDPFQIFQHSKTPAGLYARKRWLLEPNNSHYEKDLDETVRLLLDGQSSDGSWDGSFIKTVRRLFGLHLTVREETEPVQRGINWLIKHAMTFYRKRRLLDGGISPDVALSGLPFTKGSFVLLITAATLFLSMVFGRNCDPGVVEIYGWLLSKGSEGKGRWCGWSSYSNILRALVFILDTQKARLYPWQ